jgi:hypothetical protein
MLNGHDRPVLADLRMWHDAAASRCRAGFAPACCRTDLYHNMTGQSVIFSKAHDQETQAIENPNGNGWSRLPRRCSPRAAIAARPWTKTANGFPSPSRSGRAAAVRTRGSAGRGADQRPRRPAAAVLVRPRARSAAARHANHCSGR